MNEQVVNSSVTNRNIWKIEVNFTIKLKNEQVVSSRVMNRNIRKIQIKLRKWQIQDITILKLGDRKDLLGATKSNTKKAKMEVSYFCARPGGCVILAV